MGLNAGLAALSLHTGRIGNSHSVSAGYVQQHLPPSSLVGAFQSGAIGYFNDNVINLDGKVNPDVVEVLANHRLNDYVIDHGIDYVIDWPDVIEGNLLKPQGAERYWEKCNIVVPNDRSVCLQRVR